jgi:hypothetical protein
MPLTDDYQKAVTLLLRSSVGRSGDLDQSLAGTAFAVALDSETLGPALKHLYLVTAAHVVRGALEVHARTRLLDGSLRDEPIPGWVFHHDYDVAVAPLRDSEDVDGASIPVERFTDDADLGDAVFFIGLLRNMAAMGDAGVPMVRSGTVGRLWQDNIRARLGDIETELTGHLIDCRAYQGMSGSPCFLQHSYPVLVPVPDSADEGLRTWTMQHVFSFFGMIAAHFDDSEEAGPASGDPASSVSVRYRVHTGVGVVTPARFIRETLDDEDLVKSRREADRREAARRPENGLVTTLHDSST